ncbi:vacuolar assembling/sorting protein VPS16 [Mycena olivaceomarginata]|nr:vacuolar assembling/sorting protein VPS16 [Mycena olivaceomarginata]
MSAERPSSRWQIMQDGRTFYKRQQLYSIPGKLPNLSDYIVAGCLYGGPIGLRRLCATHTKLIALGRSTPAITKAQIQIYSPAGEGLLLFSWDQGKIIRFGWTVDERLAILNEEGTYRLYDLQGDYQQYSLGNEAGEMGVIDARIHENGLVALTGSLSLLEVKGWEGTRPLTLANPGLSQPPNSWAVIPPDLNISRHVEVLLSVDSTIFTVDNLECIDQRLSQGPFTHVSPSPNGKSLALLTFSGTLLVVSADFQRTLAEFKTGDVAAAEGAVHQVEWCGIDAILVTWDNLAVVVGPFGDTLEYYYSGPTFAVTEPDGIRIIGPDVCDLIQKVPTSSASIFRPGSTSASAILYDAWESFSQRSPQGGREHSCIEAAGQEWEPYWQRRLLNAAKFGRGFLDLHNPTDFINMGQTLKVLNAVRFYEIGIPLTPSTVSFPLVFVVIYIYASPSRLITRLTARNMHLLALRVSTYLSIKPDADAELAGDEDVCKLIVDKFEQLGGADVSYAEIAKRAWEVGRSGLATKLLDHEPRASDQVPLLLSMKEDRLALVKAVDSGDTDLVYHVLLHLHKRLPLGSFFRLIEDGGAQLAPASKLLEVYAREQNREMLRDFFYSDDRRVESAVLSLDEAANIADPTSKITAVRAAQKFFSEDKDRGFESKMMDESARLLTLQQQLEKEADGKIVFFGLSVNETIRTLVVNGMAKRADKLKSDFKVPDKRFWFVKMQSPIGYEPFVRHLVDAGYPKEAISYRDLYVECGEWRMAGKECKERGDKAKLDSIRQKCPNSLIARELDQILASMK